MQVTFKDCFDELVDQGGGGARAAYEQWKRRPGYDSVVSFVHGFCHQAVFEITPEEVQRTIRQTEHALGDVPKESQIGKIEDFTCPFALQHIFHRLIERTGDIPTWQRFWSWMQNQARPYWLDQIEPLRTQLRGTYTDERIDDAIRWRLGKFYYSAVREVDLLAFLHSNGVRVKYHLLADVLLRVDYWIDEKLICAYLPNARYRTAGSGRKPPAERFFQSSRRPFEIIDFEVERQGFGRTWLVSEASKRRLVGLLE